MSEWRHDPLSGRWVLIAPERGQRPNSDQREPLFAPMADDPFAEGCEAGTTPEVLALREADSLPDRPGWQVRIIANKYPALHPDVDATIADDGWYRKAAGGGVHEVVIECPQHETHLSRLSVEHIAQFLQLSRQRLAMLRHEGRWPYALLFKNHGRGAGATLPHSHSQLMALPFIPEVVRRELATTRQHRERTGRSWFTEWMTREQAVGRRFVRESPKHLSLCPFASRFPYEMCILPQVPTPHFDELSDADVVDLAAHLKWLLQSLEVTANDPPYNLVLRTAPFQGGDVADFSWRLEILPRIGGVAGYEWGTGWFINPQPPEEAAERLRLGL